MGKHRRISTAVVCTRRSACGLETLMQVKRKHGKWEFAGGKLKGHETVEVCAKREFKEEVGLTASKLDFLVYMEADDDFCCLVFHAKMLNVEESQPTIMEPDKHPVLGWIPIDRLPNELTRDCQAVLDQGVIDLVKESYV